jgi:hypothetical protein
MDDNIQFLHDALLVGVEGEREMEVSDLEEEDAGIYRIFTIDGQQYKVTIGLVQS